ncbi:MAG: adenylyl-sulfate kinase, partial [Nitrosarchaeum sp.]|nr:adenylyl-sulfate kinase [Nitrosarchaeum sp.]
MSWCIWITGLPGSGKSTIAKELLKILEMRGVYARHLRMDEIRKSLTPKLEYTEKERDVAYTKLVSIAKNLVEDGVNTIIDATGHKKKWRNLARSQIKDFVEVFVDCPLEVCIERETKRKDNLVTKRMY